MRLSRFALLFVLLGCSGQIGEPGASDPGRDPEARCAADGAPSLPQRVVRLSNRHYANGVRDLLGLGEAPVLTNGGDRADTLFSGGTDRVTDPIAFEYDLVATNAAALATADLPRRLACAGGADELACARAFVERFAARAFRRPLDADERARLLSVFDVGQAEDGTVRGGVELVIRAVLQAPSFVYRTEIGAPSERGDTFALTPYEVASELALLFLDSPVPDEALWRAAESGALATDAGILAEVDRLMSEPVVQANVAEILMRWVGASQLATKEKDAPEFTDELRDSMLEESRVFFRRHVFEEDATLSDLLTTRTTWLDAPLASFYGVPRPTGASDTELARVALPDGERVGLLTRAAVLAALADRDRTSVVHRGLFVARGLLCQEYAPPPAGASDNPERTGDTERARAEYRMRTAPCSGCHTGFDPFGVLFEQYDEIGRFRAEVDASFEVVAPASVAGPTEDVVELAERIADAPELLDCTARQMASYSVGRPLTSGELCDLDAIATQLAASGGSVRELFRAIAVSPVVRLRHAGGVAP